MTRFEGVTKAYGLRIPAVPEVAALVGCKPITKKNWLEIEGKLFSRVTEIESITPKPFVYDLKAEGDASYMTSAGLAHNGGRRKGAGGCHPQPPALDTGGVLRPRKSSGDDRRPPPQ